MTALPTKYVPVEHSMLGVAALLIEMLRPTDTVPALWDRAKVNQRIRSFDRFADGLTLLFAGGIIVLDRGVLRRVMPVRIQE